MGVRLRYPLSQLPAIQSACIWIEKCVIHCCVHLCVHVWGSFVCAVESGQSRGCDSFLLPCGFSEPTQVIRLSCWPLPQSHLASPFHEFQTSLLLMNFRSLPLLTVTHTWKEWRIMLMDWHFVLYQRLKRDYRDKGRSWPLAYRHCQIAFEEAKSMHFPAHSYCDEDPFLSQPKYAKAIEQCACAQAPLKQEMGCFLVHQPFSSLSCHWFVFHHL